jgi:hypothetical protein
VEQYPENEHVSTLCDQLMDEAFRRAFADDHAQALKQADIDEQALPEGMIEAIRGCSAEELATLARVRGALEAANVPPRYIACMV